jgi:DNA helicase-4
MGFLDSFFQRRRKAAIEGDTVCSEFMQSFSLINKKAEDALANNHFYIDPELPQKVAKEFKDLETKVADNAKIIKKSKKKGELHTRMHGTRIILSGFMDSIPLHNHKVADNLIVANSALLCAEGKEFDIQQKGCIVKDVHNHLVLSGAGTGKTMTIVGKAKYLMGTGICDPEKLIVLSFTRKTAAELKDRIRKETGRSVEVSTFHKLGLEIIESSNKSQPKIMSEGKHSFIRDALNELSKDESYCEKLLCYASEVEERRNRRYWEERKQRDEDYRSANPIRTKRGETVKSYGEKDIADFLFANKINYVYESSYKVDDKGTKYRPDFFLPENGIYIEYYGIDRDGKVPPYFSSRDGKTPSETYSESMKWKEDIHEKKGTKFIKSYAYERWEGTLLRNLRKGLTDHGVKFPKESSICIDDDIFSSIASVFESLLNKIKSKNISVNDVRMQIKRNGKNIEENELALSLFEPIFNKYQSSLIEKGEIDFDDMINIAAEYVRNGRYIHRFDHVLVDEYQDISDSRFNLLSELRKTKDFNLFAVGDDWQSIYGFTGSNLSFLYDFQKCWGVAEESKIETTYRFPEKLIEVSGRFIMKNPKQIAKRLKANNKDGFALVEHREDNEAKAVKGIVDRLVGLPKDSTVLLLGRYERDRNLLHYDLRVEKTDSAISIPERSDLKISFLTVHSSKGLQADCVVILNNKDDVMGFPSKMADPAIVSLLDDNSDSCSFSEERRVYYVALTRAKKMLILLTTDKEVSPFAKEIIENNAGLIEKNYVKVCPICGGRLIRRKGYSEFLGCSNYSAGCTHKEKIS